jgi:predicted regulator of Ras-like GTPase activity (Roadblock/LC7/MglB family)
MLLVGRALNAGASMLGAMDADQAIVELTDISPQVRQVVVVAADGAVVVGNVADDDRARALADGGLRLAEAADEVRAARGLGPAAQLEAATVGGSVFVVREGGRSIVATTTPEPTVGLVFYDLKTCLRAIEEPAPRKKRTKKADDATA